MDIASLYQEYRDDIVKLARCYASRHGGDAEELIADGSLAFLRAVQTHDESKGELRKRITVTLWRSWQDKTRREGKHSKRETAVSVLESGRGGLFSELPVSGKLDGVSEDADAVIRAVIDPPPDMLITANMIHSSMRPVSLRLALIEYLQDIGWGMERIAESFAEVAEALCD